MKREKERERGRIIINKCLEQPAQFNSLTRVREIRERKGEREVRN